MATKIETLKKPNGDQVLPRTRAKAVSMENGTTVEAAIGNLNTNIDTIIESVESAKVSLYSDLNNKAPAYTYGTEDLVAGETALETGKLHFVYE